MIQDRAAGAIIGALIGDALGLLLQLAKSLGALATH